MEVSNSSLSQYNSWEFDAHRKLMHSNYISMCSENSCSCMNFIWKKKISPKEHFLYFQYFFKVRQELFLLVKSFLKKRRKIINIRIVSVGRGIYANFTTLSMLNQMKFCSQSAGAHSLLRGVVKLSAVGDFQEGAPASPPLPPTSDVLVLCSPTHEFAILLHLQHVQRQQPLEFWNLPRNSTHYIRFSCISIFVYMYVEFELFLCFKIINLLSTY